MLTEYLGRFFSNLYSTASVSSSYVILEVRWFVAYPYGSVLMGCFAIRYIYICICSILIHVWYSKSLLTNYLPLKESQSCNPLTCICIFLWWNSLIAPSMLSFLNLQTGLYFLNINLNWRPISFIRVQLKLCNIAVFMCCWSYSWNTFVLHVKIDLFWFVFHIVSTGSNHGYSVSHY